MIMRRPVAYCAGIFRVLLFQAVHYRPPFGSIYDNRFPYYKRMSGVLQFSDRWTEFVPAARRDCSPGRE